MGKYCCINVIPGSIKFMVHGLLESIERSVELWSLEFKIEWVTVSATFCTAAFHGLFNKSLSGPQCLPKNF